MCLLQRKSASTYLTYRYEEKTLMCKYTVHNSDTFIRGCVLNVFRCFEEWRLKYVRIISSMFVEREYLATDIFDVDRNIYAYVT